MTGLKIFSIMAAHGTEIFSANVTKLFDLAKEFADLIEAACGQRVILSVPSAP